MFLSCFFFEALMYTKVADPEIPWGTRNMKSALALLAIFLTYFTGQGQEDSLGLTSRFAGERVCVNLVSK